MVVILIDRIGTARGKHEHEREPHGGSLSPSSPPAIIKLRAARNAAGSRRRLWCTLDTCPRRCSHHHVLSTARLQLRQWRDDDLEPCAAMSRDPEVMAAFPKLLTTDETAAAIRAQRDYIAEHGHGF